jgi:hypothetical protein
VFDSGSRWSGRWVLSGLLLFLGGVQAQEPPGPDTSVMIQRGEQFLVQMFDRSMDLLPEFPGSTTYWLYHDNYLAAKMLEKVDPILAGKIRARIQSFGVATSGKIEILFGELQGPPRFWQFDLSVVDQIGDKVIKTERVTDRELKGWEKYADLLAMRVIGQPRDAQANDSFEKLLSLWDGRGFADPATKLQRIYATYKLALALIASQKIDRPLPFRKELLSRLQSQQASSGGWITDFDPAGNPRGFANVETTCMVLLALQGVTIND